MSKTSSCIRLCYTHNRTTMRAHVRIVRFMITLICVYLVVRILLSGYSVLDDDRKEPKPICVMFTFVNAANNAVLQDAFRTTASSILRHASVPLDIYIIGDKASKDLGENIIKQSSSNVTHPYKVNALRKKANCYVLQ